MPSTCVHESCYPAGARPRRRLPLTHTHTRPSHRPPPAQLYDTDGNGHIDVDELYFVLKDMGVETSEARLAKLFREADTRKCGHLRYSQFLNVWVQVRALLLAAVAAVGAVPPFDTTPTAGRPNRALDFLLLFPGDPTPPLTPSTAGRRGPRAAAARLGHGDRACAQRPSARAPAH